MARQRGNGEGSVFFDKSRGKFRAFLYTADGKRKFLGDFKTKEQAKAALRTAQNEREQGTLVAGPRQTLGQFLARWLEDSVKPTAKVRTYQTYEEKARLHIIPELGKVPLARLTPQRVQALYAKKHAEGLSPATVNLIHVVLHRSLKQARRWGLVGRNVADDVDAPRRARLDGSAKALTGDQLHKLLGAIDGHRYERFWLVLIATGLRFGEAAALRWDDIDLAERTVAVRRQLTRVPGGFDFTPPKTARGRRIVPLPPSMVPILAAQHTTTKEMRLLAGSDWQDLDLVFPNSVGKPLRGDHVLAAFHSVLERHGLPRKRIHDLRHTYATRLFANNKHVRAVQELMGHSRSDMTMEIYTASVPEVLRDAADSLDVLFSHRQPKPPAQPAVADLPR